MYVDLEGSNAAKLKTCKNLLVLSAIFAFSIGLTIGILLAVIYIKTPIIMDLPSPSPSVSASSMADSAIRNVFLNISYRAKQPDYAQVSFVASSASSRDASSSLVSGGIFWGEPVEKALPGGYQSEAQSGWSRYVSTAVAVKLEIGCGRMQNRLVTFEDGRKGCVRYRQNTDQIQGELFSFYLAQVLSLPNLAPSAVSIINLELPLWRNLRNDISAAQWHSSKPVVLTEYIPDLANANIPPVFQPIDRHLNKLDVFNLSSTSSSVKAFVELAQWSDLIVFDYLTANLDRIVNNLYNYQWNTDIMNAPAHNLARQKGSELLVFLDNESGLLHGYRLLKKYEVYHSTLLDNLCVFRRRTAEAIALLRRRRDVGERLRALFEHGNSELVRDLLPSLPEKSVKILNERIDRVHGQIVKCQEIFAKENNDRVFINSDEDDRSNRIT